MMQAVQDLEEDEFYHVLVYGVFGLDQLTEIVLHELEDEVDLGEIFGVLDFHYVQ